MKTLKARFKRWLYMLVLGFWRGEHNLDYAGSGGMNLLTGKGSIMDGTWKTTRIWLGRDDTAWIMENLTS